MTRKPAQAPKTPPGRTSTPTRRPKRSQAFPGAPRRANSRALAVKSIVPKPTRRRNLHSTGATSRTANVHTLSVRKPRERPRPEPDCICIGCGCTDNHACVGDLGDACYWVAVNRPRCIGVCSECAVRMLEALIFPNQSDAEINREIMAVARS